MSRKRSRSRSRSRSPPRPGTQETPPRRSPRLQEHVNYSPFAATPNQRTPNTDNIRGLIVARTILPHSPVARVQVTAPRTPTLNDILNRSVSPERETAHLRQVTNVIRRRPRGNNRPFAPPTNFFEELPSCSCGRILSPGRTQCQRCQRRRVNFGKTKSRRVSKTKSRRVSKTKSRRVRRRSKRRSL